MSGSLPPPAAPSRGALPIGFAAAAVHVFALSGFAVAQPLYDLLGRYPTFFVAHGASPGTIVAFALGLALGPALLLIAGEGVVRLLGRRAWWSVHVLVVAWLITLIVLPPLHRAAAALPPAVSIALACAIGTLATVAYARRTSVRRFCSLLAAAAVVFPLVFLLFSPLAPLLRPTAAPAAPAAAIADPAPVVMVVFDELSLFALLDGAGGIDAARFPHFAALARDATWYRNATTVADYTPVAIPALLTGRLPDHNRIPVSAEHPDSLFSLLAPTYHLEVLEPVTRLCAACGQANGEAGAGNAALLYGDALVVWLHMLAPPAWRARLPDIGRQWTFRFESWLVRHLAGPVRGDRPGAFTAFVDRIAPRGEPTLWFAHVLLPHYPYEYLPSGTRYNAPPADFRRQRFDPEHREQHRGWTVDNAAGAAQEQLRYLLQLGLVDALLGRLLDHLRDSGLYDESLLIVTADHGVSFRPGESQRFVTTGNAADILWVPLFVKAPHQAAGAVDDRNVQTIDVLPTVAALLGAPVAWRVDGRSVLDPAAPGAAAKVAFSPASLDNQLELAPLTLPPTRPQQPPAWRTQAELFPPGMPLASLLAHGPAPALIGQRADQLARRSAAPFRAEIFDAALYDDVRPARGAVPAFVRGRLTPSAAIEAPPPLAIAVNGIVAATTESFVGDDGTVQFGVLVPEQDFSTGANRVEVFGILVGGQGLMRLAP